MFWPLFICAQEEKPVKTPEVEEETDDLYAGPNHDLSVSTVTVGSNMSEYEVRAEELYRPYENLAEMGGYYDIHADIFQTFEYDDFRNSSESSEQYEEYEAYEDRYGPAEREGARTWHGQVWHRAQALKNELEQQS